MKQVLIIEHQTSPIQQIKDSVRKNILGGIFTEFDILNRNERIYTPEKFLPALNEMNSRISEFGLVYGELDHPEDFNISVKNASHAVINTNYVKEHNRVDGKIQLLSNVNGKNAQTIIFEDGLPLFVSSRAAGVTTGGNNVEIKKLFTYDLVADPGFASAKVSPLNESLGLKTNKVNYRIYEVSDQNDVNDLYKMQGQHETVTHETLADFSNHLMTSIKQQMSEMSIAVSSGKVAPEEILKMEETLESLCATQSHIVKYLDYFANTTQTIVNMVSTLENKTENIIKHNDYLAEHTNNLVNHNNTIAENLNNVINYADNLGDQLNNTINYSNMIAEKLNYSINHANTIAEHVNNVIFHVDYIGENLENTIHYCDNLGYHLTNSIGFTEYMAEQVFVNSEYTKMIKEELDGHSVDIVKTANFTNYLSENLNTTVNYTGMIVDKLNGTNISENKGDRLPSLEEAGFVTFDNKTKQEEEVVTQNENKDLTTTTETNEKTEEAQKEGEAQKEEEVKPIQENNNNTTTVENVNEEVNYEDFSLSLDSLIEEVRNKKIEENRQPHFLTFMDKIQVETYYNLKPEEQNKVKLHLENKIYYSNAEVIALINEALEEKESLEQTLIKNIPSNIQEVWVKLDESTQRSVLSQAMFYPSLQTKSQIEMFWNTRDLKAPVQESSKIEIERNPLITLDKFSDEQVQLMLERLKQIS